MDSDPPSSISTPWPNDALPEEWVEKLFDEMSFTYGMKFVDQWRGFDTRRVKQHWARKLGALSPQQLRDGVRQLPSRAWPPTLPEFMALCRPPLNTVVAFYEAVEQGARRERGEPNVWSCPAVYWAWRKIGAYDFAHLGYVALEARWEAALAAELSKPVVEDIPVQRLAVAAPGRSLTGSDAAKALLADFKFKEMGTVPPGDGRDWARKILADRKKHTLAVIQCAEAALRLR